MIKNFIYLDERKLYSFSSQLFEGVTEYVLREEATEKEDTEESKDGITSSRMIADAIRETSRSTEKKFLHDHSFNLFETELINTSKLLDIAANELSFEDICNSGKSFIRITAKGKFVDMTEIQHLFSSYAKISEAIALLPLTGQLQQFEKLKSENPKSQAVKSQQSELDKIIRQRTAEISANLPQQSVKGFETIIENFGDDIVRFQQQLNNVVFSTCLTQEFLREPLKNIYRKYSRKTEKEFTVLGFISHADGTQEAEIQDVPDDQSMLQHMIALAENMYDLEQTFGRKSDNEIIIEPIAIYTEL